MQNQRCFTENCRIFRKPKIFCSKCITFEYCRWNGQIIASPEVERLKPFIDFIIHCPEKEIGLGVPRNSLRLVLIDDQPHLVQPDTQKNFTRQMVEYSHKIIGNLPPLDGIILKAKSPSCGIRGVKLYKEASKPFVIEYGAGIFGKQMTESFDYLPIISEGRLRNIWLFEAFLTQIYTNADFHYLLEAPTHKKLVEFHTRNKFLFMAYNQIELKRMGQIVANPDKFPIDQVMMLYKQRYYLIMNRSPRYTRHINVLMHALGYFKENLTSMEKEFFLQELEYYRHGILPLTVLIHIIRNWIVKYDQDYLQKQTYFYPFPDELIEQALFYSNEEKLERTGHK